MAQASPRRRWGVRARRRWRGFSWCDRRANGQSPALPPPFSARRRTVSLGGRAVDGLTIAGIGARQRVKQPKPNAAHRPAAKAIVDRRRRPEEGRAILPATASFQNVDDAADPPPVGRRPDRRVHQRETPIERLTLLFES